MPQQLTSATAMAPTNLALIKYWGKRDAKLNLPINSSVSVTLDQRDLQTVTTASLVPGADRDRLWVNGVEEELNARAKAVLGEMRLLAPSPDVAKTPIWIVSRNSFPTAAGLASSAAGYAAMVTALAGLFKLDTSSNAALLAQLTRIARRGSGSACRSLMGGIVAWHMGTAADGSDSQAEQVVPSSHWPDLEAVVCVASDRKKHVSSTSGMATSVETSLLLAHRAKVVVPERFAKMLASVKARDAKAVLELTMRDSNQFHACCLDTFPPIFYMTDTSRHVVRLVDELNAEAGADGPKFAYTFDAGPNAVIFCDRADTPRLIKRVVEAFPPSLADMRKDPEFLFVRGRSSQTRAQVLDARQALAGSPSAVDGAGELMYVFHTGIGEGARVLQGAEEQERRLADPETGLPLSSSS